MKKRIALALCLILLVSMVLAGCGTDPKKDLVGAWESQIDVSELARQEIADGDESVVGYFDDVTFGIQFDLTLGEDDTFTMAVNEAALETALNNLITQASAGMQAYFEDMLVEQNLDMTLEELLAFSGISSIEELLEEAMAIAMEEMDLDSMTLKGTYTVQSGKLVMTMDGVDEEVPYTLENGVLTLTVSEMGELLGGDGTMTFQKAG